MLDLHCDQGLNNPPIVLEALVQGRRSINTPYMASSEIKAQGHPIYLNKGSHDEGCVSVGMIPIKPPVKENAFQAFFLLVKVGLRAQNAI